MGQIRLCKPAACQPDLSRQVGLSLEPETAWESADGVEWGLALPSGPNERHQKLQGQLLELLIWYPHVAIKVA